MLNVPCRVCSPTPSLAPEQISPCSCLKHYVDRRPFSDIAFDEATQEMNRRLQVIVVSIFQRKFPEKEKNVAEKTQLQKLYCSNIAQADT